MKQLFVKNDKVLYIFYVFYTNMSKKVLTICSHNGIIQEFIQNR